MKKFSPLKCLTLTLGLITFTVATLSADEETHTFTNAEGKSLEAEIVGVSSGKVSLKLKNGKIFTMPFAKLSEADQTFIKAWYEKNKGNINPNDLSLTIDKKQERVREPREKSDKKATKGGASTKKSTVKISYDFKLSQRTSTPIENITVHTLIVKRTTTKGDDAAEVVFEQIVEEKNIASLTLKTPEEWTSAPQSCEDVSTKSKTASSSSEEEILGIVVTVSAGGKELFKNYEPSNFEKDLVKIQEKNPEIGKKQEADSEPAEKKKGPKKKAAKKGKKEAEKKKEEK